MQDTRNSFLEVFEGPNPGHATRLPDRERLPAYVSADPLPLERLDDLRALVIGTGAVGGPLAVDLARLAPAQIGIVDPGIFKAQSVATQPIQPGEVGCCKAELMARRCKEISPRTRVLYYPGAVQELSLVELAQFNMAILATDNLFAEVESGRHCTALGIPMIQGSVQGETMVVHVRFFGNASADSPCPACGFGRQEWDLFGSEVSFSCEGAAAATPRPEVATQPTMSTSGQCGLAASLVINQVLRATLRLGAPVEDSLLEYCGMTHRSHLSALRRNPDCPCEHRRYELSTARRPLERCSLAELAKQAGPDELLDFTVGEWRWAERGVCECGHEQAVGLFVAPGHELAGHCARCGRPLHCQPFFLHRRIGAACFETIGHRPLHELGAERVDWALVRSGHGGVLFQNPAQENED